MENLWLGMIALVAYLLGSFSPAYLISRFVLGEKNLSEFATGTLGGMNVFRLSSSKGCSAWKAGILLVMVIAGDVSKAITAVAIAKCDLLLLGYNETAGLIIAAFFVVIGHNHSLFIRLISGKFRGGRGISSVFGVALFLNWPFALIGFGVFLAIILAGEFVEYLFRKGSGWKIRKIDKLLGAQVPGRMAGLVIVVAAGIWFLPGGYYLAFLAGSLPMLLSHVVKTYQYFSEIRFKLAPD